jgi:hypothetical protein
MGDRMKRSKYAAAAAESRTGRATGPTRVNPEPDFLNHVTLDTRVLWYALAALSEQLDYLVQVIERQSDG